MAHAAPQQSNSTSLALDSTFALEQAKVMKKLGDIRSVEDKNK